MPYGRPYPRRRRKSFRANGYNRTGGFYRGMVGGRELKFLDLAKASTFISENGTIMDSSITRLVQGAGQDERIGEKWTAVSLTIRWIAQVPTRDNTTTPFEAFNIYIYHDKQCNGIAATPGNILELPGTNHLQSFMNLGNRERFRILRKVHVSMNPDTNVYDSLADLIQLTWPQKQGQIHIKLRMPIYQTGATADLTTVKSNNIGILCISEHSSVEIAFKIRLRFIG